ncbi:MAG: TIGR03085 family protein [Propionibacteriales bacterium]|nr:TIGR03085 family protein [Propionibacteriales bacterium]
MASLARRERAALCDLLDQVGPDAPTLCGGWSTHDLTAHLVLREASPLAAIGIVVPQLEQVADRGMERLKEARPYGDLVQRVREGPPWYSPMRPGKVDRAVNAMEFYVHHEDVRRAGAEWSPRELSARDQHALWSRTRLMSRMLGRGATVGIELVRTDETASARLAGGEPTLVVRGVPSELALFAYGRGAVADVELAGDADAVASFTDSQLGF